MIYIYRAMDVFAVHVLSQMIRILELFRLLCLLDDHDHGE